MTLKDLELKLKKEMTNQIDIANNSTTIRDKDHAAVKWTVISDILNDIKKLNGEDLKKAEKLFCKCQVPRIGVMDTSGFRACRYCGLEIK